MTTRLVALLIAFAGCVSYSGGARSVDRSQLPQDWLVPGPLPELRQVGPYDCGAVSLAIVAGHWQVPLSQDAAVAALPPPSTKGTRLKDLRDLARARGFDAFAIAGDRETLVHELHAGRPVIVGLLLPFGRRHVQSHYEVIVGVNPTADRFVTINPTSGWRIRSWNDLDAEWHPVGRPALVVVGHN